MISTRFNNYGVHLVESEDDLNMMLSSFSTKINVGIDTETTGLDYIDDHIVGICISGGKSYSDYHGYYIPVRHQNYNNIPLEKALEVTQKCLDSFKTCFFNRSFDFTMLEKEGIDISKSKSFDIQIMAHLALNISFPSLKQVTKQILGFDVLTFDSVSKTHNFGHTDPKTSYVYGASDPVITVLLGKELWSRFPYIRRIFPLDNKVGEAIRYISNRTELPLNKDVLEVELNKVNKELLELQNKIFSFVGYRFRLTSNKDKAEALSRFITLTEKTKGGQYSVKEDVLKDLNHPLADMFIKQAQLEKYRSSYLQKMFDFPDKIKINYSSVNVATGRLSSGSSKGNNFFANLNIQNIPKEEVNKYLYPHPSLGVFALSKDYIPFPKDYFEVEEPLTTETCLSINGTSYPQDVLIPSLDKLISELNEGDILPTGEVVKTIFKKRELCGKPKESITLWGEQVVVTSDKQIKTKGGLREAFIPPKGYVHLSGDYASEEMRLIGNFAKEPHYLEPIKNGLDIHSYVAEKMFGFFDKAHRTKVKTLNFSVNYGAGAPTIAKKLGISIEEATELLDNYNKTLSKLTRWKEETMKQARRTGMSFTLFGRPRLLYKYYNSSIYSDRAFADRTAINNPIQGAVTKDTKILTNAGYIQFSEIIKGLTRLDSTERHKTLKVSNGSSFVDFSVFAQGVTTVKRVSLKNGLNVKASEQHLFKVLTDEGIVDVWRDNLKVGDKVVCIFPRELDTQNEDNKDELLWRLAGHYLGDGVLYDKYVKICCSLEEVDSFYDLYKPFGSHSKSYQLSNKKQDYEEVKLKLKNEDRVYTTKGRLGHCAYFSVDKQEELLKMGFVVGSTAKTKRIPESVFKASLSKKASFIRGFYDADGFKVNEQIGWHMCQRPILEDLQLLLSTCGIESNLYNCGDGTYVLYIRSHNKFCNLVGLENNLREKTERIQSKRTPRFLIDSFIEAYNKYGLSKSTFLGNKKLEGRNRSLLSKMRNNKSVGINTFNSMCKDYGFIELTSYFTYSEVKSIESCKDEETFCICMEDEAHQYVANGMIHHNCTPTCGFLELKNQVIQMDKFLGQRLTYDSSVLIPTHRGTSKPLLCVFNTKDFLVCDSNHSLVTGKLDQPKESKLSNFFSFKGRRQKVLLSKKPFPKIAINSYLFDTSKAISYIKLNCKKEVLDNKDNYMKTSFLCLALTKKWFSYDLQLLSKIRSLASIYGYNCLYSEKKDKIRISFNRSNKAKIKAIYQLSDQDIEMGTCTSVYGYQMYRNQGFWNKNTGGDIIRLGLCKIYDLMLNNKEFRENVQFASTVHDEFNFFIKPHYLHEAYKIVKELMYFNIPQFEVPIVADISIGTNWGNLVDVEDVTEDNKIVVKE